MSLNTTHPILFVLQMRLLARTALWVSELESPLRIRQKVSNTLAKRKVKSIPSAAEALNIGEFDINADGTTREDPSWDGEDDPFYHLSPEERMKVLKSMSLQDIYQAGLNRKTQSKKEKMKWTNRNKKFKRPDL